MRVGVVGAGMAGLSCAQSLASRGMTVSVFDKGRGPGGRLSSRRMHTAEGQVCFDHGAPLITATNAAFTAQLDMWSRDGAAARWPAAGENCWVGTPAMNAIAKQMAQTLEVSSSVFVRGLSRTGDGWHLVQGDGLLGPFDAVVIALPAEQAAAMLGLHDLDMGRAAVLAPSQPCWTAMLAFSKSLGAQAVIREQGIIALATLNTGKRGRTGPEAWTIHASSKWSRAHLDADPQFVIEQLSGALADILGTGPLRPIAEAAHRWRYAHAGSAGVGAMWDPAKKLGACGDWLSGQGAESAWLSGQQLADLMTSSPGEALG